MCNSFTNLNENISITFQLLCDKIHTCYLVVYNDNNLTAYVCFDKDLLPLCIYNLIEWQQNCKNYQCQTIHKNRDLENNHYKPDYTNIFSNQGNSSFRKKVVPRDFYCISQRYLFYVIISTWTLTKISK